MFRPVQKSAESYLNLAKDKVVKVCNGDATAAEMSAAAASALTLLTVVNYLSGAGYVSTTLSLASTLAFTMSAINSQMPDSSRYRFFGSKQAAAPMAVNDAAPSMGPKKTA